ncbi:MAG: response regulator [Hyphomonadaceae bacterium]
MLGNLFQKNAYVLLGAAMALPVVVLVAVLLVFTFQQQRVSIEREALAQAEQIMQLSDALIDTNESVMEVLATADAYERHDWPAAYARAREIAALNPSWRDVIVSDLRERQEVFSLRAPYSTARHALNRAIVPNVGRVGGIVRDGPGCPCIYLHMPIGADGRYLLTVALDPAPYQQTLLRHVPGEAVGAVVDRNGDFVARTVDYADRIGTPSTVYVRRAIASGEARGIYEGRTWEGFRNHTAFVTSPTTGWSTHIAVASSLIDAPMAFSNAAVIVATLIALAIAAGLIFWALRDLAERRRAEERLAQTQKLEAIGQLTGGVAHDFNNLLTVIIGGLNMLLKRIDDPKQRQIAEHMLDAAQRGDKLTKQLLAFSRGKRMELAPVDLHQMLPGMEELLRRSIDPGMQLAINLDPDARWVRSDANQLELAVLNLVINARDAMPDGGRIEISTRGRDQGDLVELAVRDTGLGMPKEVADRAMEPFFTTKPAGKGTGLGLAQVFGALRQSGGNVEIDTALGRGTTIRLLLARTEAPTAAPEPAEAAPEPVRGAGQSVLVVDDEAGVRSFMAETLREAGYTAREAADPGEALRLLQTETPDLLLTDFSMPGMTGLELAERSRAQTAGLRVLIVSGYADAAALEASDARPALLRKPFDERALLTAVRDVLAA